jgi:hypothetical protein
VEGVIEDLEFRLQSFVIKVWTDDPDSTCDQRTWRGRITHVPTGESRSITELGEITSFIGAYLKQMGISAEGRRKGRSWLGWLKPGSALRCHTKGKSK